MTPKPTAQKLIITILSPLLALTLSWSVLFASSQNEVQINVLYDGTPGYTTPDNINDFDSWQGVVT